MKHFMLYTLILLSIVGAVSAHDIIIVENKLIIDNEKILFQNDGGLADILAGIQIKEYVEKNIIIKSLEHPCVFGELM